MVFNPDIIKIIYFHEISEGIRRRLTFGYELLWDAVWYLMVVWGFSFKAGLHLNVEYKCIGEYD